MLKKVAMAGLAVVVGVVVLAWISPTLYDYIVNQIMSAKNNAENSIPLEKRIEMLRSKVADLDNNKQKLVDAYGVKASAAKETEAEVAKMTSDLKDEMARIDKFTEDLDTQKTSYKYQDKEYSRDDVKAQLAEEFKRYKSAEATLNAKKELLEARKTAKAAAWEAVSSFNKQRDELAAKLDTMEAELQQVRAREAAASANVKDNDMADLGHQIDELNKKIDEKNNAADAAQGSRAARSTRWPARPWTTRTTS